MRWFSERGGEEFAHREANEEREDDQELQTIEDLGRLVKAKYPHYRSMSDSEAGKAIRDKFAPAYDDFVDTEASEKPGSIYEQ